MSPFKSCIFFFFFFFWTECRSNSLHSFTREEDVYYSGLKPSCFNTVSVLLPTVFMFVNIMMCPALLLQSFIWISLMGKGVQYDVTHIVSRMCVVQQSSVLIPCRYTSPTEQVSAAEWFFERSPEQKVRVSQDPVFESRGEFVQPDAGNCSLLLKDVRESDAGIFRFVLSTASGRNWTNDQGIQLEVTDAELEVKTESDVVMEGDWILLVCGSCIPSMTVPTYIWRKDGHLHKQNQGDNILVLESVELQDGGRYSCTISGHERLKSTSAEVTVRPGYPPKNISVSISPSGEIVEGDSVTLSCNSDAKPAAEINWFKEGKPVESGRIYSISNICSCHSGEYKCRSRNKHGEIESDAVKLNVMYAAEKSSSSVVAVGISAAVVLMSVILVVFIWLLIRRKRVTSSEEQNPRGSRHSKTLEAPEDTYMTLDPQSRCSEYDTLDNMKRSCENTDDLEAQDPTYYNTDK
uniref:Si:ch211-286b5.6 n=1 Tax=Cyprinus carpio TaxID=7962 RepID=A0A8C1N218_CYPCA